MGRPKRGPGDKIANEPSVLCVKSNMHIYVIFMYILKIIKTTYVFYDFEPLGGPRSKKTYNLLFLF